MANLKNDKLKTFFAKVKAVKNIEIIIAVVVLALIILVYSFVTTNKNNTVDTPTASETYEDMTAQLQNELARVLSNINGAGKVEVLITFDGTTEKVIANTKSVHTNSTNGSGEVISTTTTTTETPIIISSNGSSKLYVIEEKMPQIKGVIIVAEGAKNAKIRLELMRAAQTVLNVNANSIEIFAMK